MEKKKRDTLLPKRFASDDIKKWQEQANLTTGGNLTLWMIPILISKALLEVT